MSEYSSRINITVNDPNIWTIFEKKCKWGDNLGLAGTQERQLIIDCDFGETEIGLKRMVFDAIEILGKNCIVIADTTNISVDPFTYGVYFFGDGVNTFHYSESNCKSRAFMFEEADISDIENWIDYGKINISDKELEYLLEFGFKKRSNKVSSVPVNEIRESKEIKSTSIEYKYPLTTNTFFIKGKTFAVTGDTTLFEDRKVLRSYIEACGGKYTETVSAKTDYLISNEKVTASKKNFWAREYKIPIISEAELEMNVNKIKMPPEIEGDVLSDDGVLYVNSDVLKPRAYKGNKKIRAVICSDEVKEIRAEAFADCENLESFTFGSRTTIIKERVFSGSLIKKIELPESVIKMTGSCFADCEYLEEIVFPSNMRGIEEKTCQNCKGLKRVVFPSNLYIINSNAFEACTSLEEITINACVIRECAFMGCYALKNITFDDSVHEIWGAAFAGCNSLKIIKLPPYIKTVAPGAFYSVNPIELDIQDSDYRVKEGVLYNSDFTECYTSIFRSSKEINIPGTVTKYAKGYGHGILPLEKYLPDDCRCIVETVRMAAEVTDDIFVYISDLQENRRIRIEFLEGVTKLGSYTLGYAGGVKESDGVVISLPASIKSIPKDVFAKGWKLIVKEGSYAEKYAEKNKLEYDIE